MAVTVTGEAADIGVGSQHGAGPVPVPQFVFEGEPATLARSGIFLEVHHLSRLQCNFDKAALEIAVDTVFLDPLIDDVIAPPPQVPQHVGDTVAVLLADPFQPVDSVDQVPAISSGSTPADPVGFDEGYGIAAFGEGEGGGDTGETAANHADIRRLAAFQCRVRGHFIGRGRVVRACVFLFLVDCQHHVLRSVSSDLYLNQLIGIIQVY